jgi:hypothetical protein
MSLDFIIKFVFSFNIDLLKLQKFYLFRDTRIPIRFVIISIHIIN